MAYTEHTTQLPNGVDIFYTDSGAPNTADYTTLVIVHGLLFNGFGFSPLHSLVHQHNIRLILPNRRGYSGSTPFTESEVADMQAGKKEVQERLALETAWFLKYLVENQATPRVSEDRRSGGIVLVGWSLANATTLSILAHPEVVKGEVYDAVEPYLRTVVAYDPPLSATANPPPDPTLYNPLTDASVTPEQLPNAILLWISAFYEHGDIASLQSSAVNWGKPPSSPSPEEIPTIDQWTPEEKAKYLDPFPVAMVDLQSSGPSMMPILADQMDRALFGSLSGQGTFFPRVDVRYVSGSKTMGICIWPWMETSRMYAQAKEDLGKKPRKVEFVLVEGVNHFIHYHMPERFLREMVGGSS
ncbi:Alpha/Beta hydrolase protein [Roridomyces roridus]|uniref:Alpha/Beta hydrolase protein n=1 Tax=Roridomyces roridus TaxID=1738132 RepID=A0AAD7FP20_9AGAR|nr:Alpha/Beta hydrolase protein [Roridomyces roridus]